MPQADRRREGMIEMPDGGGEPDERRTAENALRTGLELADRIEEPLAGADKDITESGEQAPANRHKVLYTNLLCLACSEYRAACLLFAQGFADEAAIIMRSVFEIALQAGYVSTSPETLAAKYEEHGRAQLCECYAKMKPEWPGIANAFETLPWHDEASKAEKHETFDNRFDMAKAVDEHYERNAMRHFYRLFYPVESEISHASPAGMLRRTSLGTFDALLLLTLGFGALMFVEVVERANDMLGLGLDDDIRTANDTLRSTLGEQC